MTDTAIEGLGIGQRQRFQDLFRFVSLLGGEDVVLLGRRNGQRTLDGLQFLLFDQTRVRQETDIHLALVGLQEPNNILGAKAVADGTDFLSRNQSHRSSGQPLGSGKIGLP